MKQGAAVLAFDAELARAVATAEKRKAVPELTADEILEGFARERSLRWIDADGFGRVYFRHPMTAVERFELEAKLDATTNQITGRDLIEIVIRRACNADGSPKFKPEHAERLLQIAPADALAKLSRVLFQNRVTFEAAEKK